MIRKLKTRFVLFNMLVIGILFVLLVAAILLGSKSDIPPERWVITSLLFALASLGGSLLLSNIAIKPIKHAWQAQLNFTADASHELRTPLTIIQTNLELVLDHGDESVKSQTKWLSNILVENKRLAGLVDDLLTLSRSDAGEFMLEYSFFPLSDVIMNVADNFSPAAFDQGIKFQFSLDDKCTICADKKRITQLFVILIDNAVKYMGRPGHISIRAENNAKTILILVSDTGKGISKEASGKIFNRFFRDDSARASGSGLGLAIAKWIVESHEGKIYVKSAPGIGTEFSISLPNRGSQKVSAE